MFVVSPQAFAQTFSFSCFANSKTGADIMLFCFYVSTICCFGYYQKIITRKLLSELFC